MSARLMLRLVLAAFLAIAASAAEAGSYSVTATDDSWTNEASVNQNNGIVTTLRATASSSNASRTRSLIIFTLPTIPSNEQIVSATLKLNTTTTSTRTVTVNRLLATWSETTVTWSNYGTANFNATAEATFTPSAAGSVSVDVTALVQGWYAGTYTNFGLGLIGATSSTAIFSSAEATTTTTRPQLVITTATIAPSLTIAKAGIQLSDPVNGTTNPKAIPGAKIRYTITASNSSAGIVDTNTTQFTESVPSTMKLFVGDAGAVGSGPVVFTNGATSSGLSYTFTSLASTTDSIAFSNNNGSTYAYTPVADASGYDATVTNVRITLSGPFAGKTGATGPSFTLQLFMGVK
ncbi:MAG: DNRLRE domain-containing protein [Allosphingosinicella sp.]